MDESKVKIKQQLLAAAISYIVFLLVYIPTGWYASELEYVPSVVFPVERYIPFLPWMIIPYMSSGLFFILIFFMLNRKDELLIFFKRITFITVFSGICFMLFPLKFSYSKPEINSSFLQIFFHFLETEDTNFNQAPSLHIAYACLFWNVLSNKLQGSLKLIAGIWIFLMGISTLTVYQHHLIDIFTALYLVCITFFIFPDSVKRNFRIGMLYLFIGLLLASFTFLVFRKFVVISIFFLLVSISFFRVGLAYLHSRSCFLKKQDGTIGLVDKISCFPYLLSYKLIRHFFCKNATNPMTEIYPNVYIGPILEDNSAKKMNLDKKIKVIDLTAEIEECKSVRTLTAYYSCPMLDIASINKEDIMKTLSLIEKLYLDLKSDEKIYIHCLMGYSRSVFVAVMFIKKRMNISTREAIAYIKEKYPNAIYPHYISEN